MHDKLIDNMILNLDFLAARLRALSPDERQELLRAEPYLYDLVKRFNDFNINIDGACFQVEMSGCNRASKGKR